MTTSVLLANILNIFEIIFYIIGSFQITKRKVLFYQIMESVAGAISMLFIFNISTVVVCTVQLIKVILAYFWVGTDKLKTIGCKIVIVVICILTLVLGISTNEYGAWNLVLVFANVINTICMFLVGNVTLYKTSLFLTDIGYGITYFVTGLYIGFWFNLISMVLLLVNIIRLRKVSEK